MSKKFEKHCQEIAEFLGAKMVVAFSLKGGRKMNCGIFEFPFKNSQVSLRLHLNFNEGKLESYRLGLNEIQNSNKYIDFIEWDFAVHVYQDDSFKLDDVKKELYRITVFSDERFSPRIAEEVLPEIKVKIDCFLENEAENIKIMENALVDFSFDKSVYEDLSVNFLIRVMLYRDFKIIATSSEEEQRLKELAKANEGQVGHLMYSEFEEYINKFNSSIDR